MEGRMGISSNLHMSPKEETPAKDSVSGDDVPVHAISLMESFSPQESDGGLYNTGRQRYTHTTLKVVSALQVLNLLCLLVFQVECNALVLHE